MIRRLLILLALRRTRRAMARLNALVEGRPAPLGGLDFAAIILLFWLWP